MNTYYRTCYWLSMTTQHTAFWPLLQKVYGSGAALTVFTHSLSDVQKAALRSLLAALQPTLSRACLDNLATLYFVPSAFVTLRFQHANEPHGSTLPRIWRPMSRPPTFHRKEGKGDSKRRGISRVRQVRLFTSDRVNQSVFAGYIVTRLRIPGTYIYVLRLNAKGTLLRTFVRT